MVQKQTKKKLVVRPSRVHGHGCFLGESAAKGDFIDEYFGEIISQVKVTSRHIAKYLFLFPLSRRKLTGAENITTRRSFPTCSI